MSIEQKLIELSKEKRIQESRNLFAVFESEGKVGLEAIKYTNSLEGLNVLINAVENAMSQIAINEEAYNDLKKEVINFLLQEFQYDPSLHGSQQ